jgi:thioredoxin-related protein
MMRTSRFLIVLTAVILMSAGAWSAGDTPQKASKKDSKKNAAAPVESATPKEITWLPFDSGLAKAKAENKAIVADFYTTWCGWCKKMDATTFRDSGVVALFNQNFIGVRVNGDNAGNFLTYEGERMSERQLTQTLGVRGYPTYWFLDSEGKKIGPAPGYQPATSFILLLKYVGENHYKTMSYDNFVKQGTGKG